jgi:hypothetical protein
MLAGGRQDLALPVSDGSAGVSRRPAEALPAARGRLIATCEGDDEVSSSARSEWAG